MKQMNYLKGYFNEESEFSHRYACWANNHRGWAKMKKSNKRVAKRREKTVLKREVETYGKSYL